MSNRIYLEFGDGSQIENGQAGYASDQLWLYLPNFTMIEAAGYVFDEAKTRQIDFYYANFHEGYVGFTTEAILKGDGEIKVRMSGGKVVKGALDEGNLDGNGSDVVSDGDGSSSGDLHPERETE